MNMLDGQVAIGTGGVAASGVLPRASSPKRARSSSGPGAVPLDGLGGQIVGAGGRAVAHRADIARPAEACALALATLGRFGRVDVLGNNAGLSSKVRNIQWVHETAWESVLAVNLTGMYRAHPGRPPGHAGPAGGTVVTVSSAAAIRPGLRGGAPYGAAKAGARTLMGHVHAVLRNQGIRGPRRSSQLRSTRRSWTIVRSSRTRARGPR